MMKTIAVNVKNTDTIDTLKTMVQEMEGLGLNQQELFFAGIHMQGNKSLGYYNVPTNASINLYVTDGITILIETHTKSFSLNAKKCDTVSSIKDTIHDKEGIPPEQQVLIFSQKWLCDDQILASCGVQHNSVLQMLTRSRSTLHVNVKLIQDPPMNMSLEVQSWCTIADLKLIIGLPKDHNSKLFCYEQELKDDKTLQHYKIEDNTFLELRSAMMQIFVPTSSGEIIVMIVDEYEEVFDVVVRAAEKLNLNPHKCDLSYKGSHLISESTLSENGIGNNSTLRLVERVRGGTHE